MTKNIKSRRKFLKTGAAVAAGLGVVTLAACEEKKEEKKAATPAAPTLMKAAPVVLKVQAAWGGGIFLENAKSYVDRVNAMAGSGLKIDLLSVNSVV